MKRISILTILLMSISAHATTLSRLPVEKLFDDSDFVGTVQVTEGHMLGIGEESCGAVYTAKVIEQFRGESAGAIQFGHTYGFKVGERYLLFLSKPGDERRYLNSTNSRSERARNEYLEKCKDALVGWNVMHSGVGAIPYTWAPELKFNNGFAFPNRYISLPASMEGVEADTDARESYNEIKWYSEDAVLKLLRGMGR